MMLSPHSLTSLLLGYIIGSIPFGLILTALAGEGDIRLIGSGNIGATNVLRTGRKWLAALTLFLDAMKGTLAIVLAGTLDPSAIYLAGVGAVLGHVFPVWLKFQGGKGVATILGIVIAIEPLVAAASGILWIAGAAVWRYSSLAALIAVGALPFLALAFSGLALAALSLFLSALTFYTHKDNIKRLIQKKEPKIGSSTPSSASKANGKDL